MNARMNNKLLTGDRSCAESAEIAGGKAYR